MPAETPSARRHWVALGIAVLSVWVGAISFRPTVQAFAEPQAGTGISLIFGIPIGAFTISFTALVLVLAVAARSRTSVDRAFREVPFGSALLLFGIIGWWAAFALSADKVRLALEPSADLSCNLSLLVQCGANLQSWQGSVLGFPNPLIGLACWPAVIAVGCLVLARVRLAPWFWIVFNLGVLCAIGFVCWLIGQSIFVLGTLCPWCMVTWAVTIPLFWAVTLHNARNGRFGASVTRVLGPVYGWVPAITVGSFIVVAVIAQVRLDLLSYL